MKRILVVLTVISLLLSACSTATLEDAGKELGDTEEVHADEVESSEIGSADPLKQILYNNGVPVYSYLGRSLEDVQGEFSYYEYCEFWDTFQGTDIFFCLCDTLLFGYVENRGNEIVYIEAPPDEVSLNGFSLDLTPDDLLDLLPYPYYNEFDYDASDYFVKYSMSDMPISVTFSMPDAVNVATDIIFSLDS